MANQENGKECSISREPSFSSLCLDSSSHIEEKGLKGVRAGALFEDDKSSSSRGRMSSTAPLRPTGGTDRDGDWLLLQFWYGYPICPARPCQHHLPITSLWHLLVASQASNASACQVSFKSLFIGLFLLPSDTKLLLTKTYPEIIILEQIRNFIRTPLNKSFFPGDFEGAKPLKNSEEKKKKVFLRESFS